MKSDNPYITSAARTLGGSKSEAKAAAARENGRKGGRPPHRWFLLHRTGGVWSTFEGDRAAAEKECDRLNAADDGGTTEIHAGFRSRESAEAEFRRLNA